MNLIEIDYRVVKADTGDTYDFYATVGLTNKHIQEIAEYILADKDHQTGELQDIPHHIYDRISDAIVETAVRDMKEEDVPLYNDDDIVFQTYLPAMLIDLLPDEVVDVLPDFLFEEDEEEEGGEEDGENEEEEEFEVPAPTKENTLYLTIKQQYFDQIMDGSKTEEYREIKETTYKKYLEVDEAGNILFSLDAISEEELNSYEELDQYYIYNNGECPFIPKQNLWYLNLAVGYNKVRDTALVEVRDITFEVAKDKHGNPARFFAGEGGAATFDSNGDLCVWTAVLHLGKVVEKNIVTK